MIDMDNGQIILFQTQGGETKIEVRLSNETVWLTADQMAELFQRNKSTISRHIKKVFESGELDPDMVVAKYATTTRHGAIKGTKIAAQTLDGYLFSAYLLSRTVVQIASSHLARRTFIGNLYKKVKDPNLVGSLSGHKEGSKAFARYRDIDEDMKKELVNLLD